MQFLSYAKWFIEAIPRTPRRAGILMRLYYLWQECATQAGHAVLALIIFSMFIGIVPGFWVAWIFCGVDFLFVLALMVSLFCTTKFTKVKTYNISITPVVEGDSAKISAMAASSCKIGELYLGAFRMDSSLKCEMLAPLACDKKNPIRLECMVHTTHRGTFKIPKIATVVPEIAGMFRANFAAKGVFELLVYPKSICVSSFPFLTMGVSGCVFAPLLMPSMSRGLDFVGVREYRAGDSLRDIHHKAFARYGKPFTKEFEMERGAGAILILDITAHDYASRMQLENAICLTAGVGTWLLERGILGRFFIGDNEIVLNSTASLQDSLLQVLARIPRASLIRHELPKTWSPASRPMGPVLRIGLYKNNSPLIHKQIIVTSKSKKSKNDSFLYIEGLFLEESLKKKTEVIL